MLFDSVAILYQLICRLICGTILHVVVADEMVYHFCGALLISGVM